MLHHIFLLISLRVADSQCKTRITKNTEIFLMTVSDQPGLSVKRSILTTIAPTYQPTAKQQHLLEFIPCSVLGVSFFRKNLVSMQKGSVTLLASVLISVSLSWSLSHLCLSLSDGCSDN